MSCVVLNASGATTDIEGMFTDLLGIKKLRPAI